MDFHFLIPNWLALPEPPSGLIIPGYYVATEFIFKSSLAMSAINKITAAKLIVLINLPVLLLIASVYQIGSAVIV